MPGKCIWEQFSDPKQPAFAELLSNFDPFPKALHEVCQRTKNAVTGLPYGCVSNSAPSGRSQLLSVKTEWSFV